MKKYLLVFIVAFALSIGFTLVSIMVRVFVLNSINTSNLSSSIATSEIIIDLFSLIGPVMFFVTFYFLGKKIRILSLKGTTISLFLGALLGSTILFAFSLLSLSAQSEIYVAYGSSFLYTDVFEFFLPALTALLIVELKNRQLNDNLIA